MVHQELHGSNLCTKVNCDWKRLAFYFHNNYSYFFKVTHPVNTASVLYRECFLCILLGTKWYWRLHYPGFCLTRQTYLKAKSHKDLPYSSRSTVIFFKKNLKHEQECVGWLSWKAGWKLVESWEGHSLPLRMPLFCQYYTSWFTDLW